MPARGIDGRSTIGAMMLTGVLAPLPTPFDERDHVDPARLKAAIAHWLTTPLKGFVLLGTSGEAGLLDDAECDRVIDVARAIVPRVRPLIAGTARESTQATLRATKRAAELGADAVLVRTPAFFKSRMTAPALLSHYRAVADASPLPVVLYNFSAATGVNLDPDTVGLLAAHPNVIGIKESGSDIAQISDLVAFTSPGFRVLAGSASTFHAALCTGVSGGVLALAALLPDACVRLFDLAVEGRHDEARILQRRLLPIARLISTLHGVPGLKAALKVAGCDVGYPRPPLTPVSDAALGELRRALSSFEEVSV